MSVSSLILSILVLTQQHRNANAARSLSARRVRGTSTSRAADKYDRSITTFSPEGRLLQLEYALIAAEERGRGLTVCVECDGVVVFAFPSSDDDDDDDDEIISLPSAASTPSVSAPDLTSQVTSAEDQEKNGDNGNDASKLEGTLSKSPIASTLASTNTEHNPTHNTKIHRLSATHLLLTSGLAGDSRTLASAFRRLASSWTHINYGEVVTAREMAKEMGRVRHGIGLRPGARVLGVMGMLIGLDDTDDNDGMRVAATNDNDFGVEVRMYRSLPGGTVDRCNVCCTGGGADAPGNAARKEAMAALLRVVSPDEDDGASGQILSKEEMLLKKEQKLHQVIKEVGRVALEYHPDSQAKEGSSNSAEVPAHDDNKAMKRVAVDIWAVRAAPTIPAKHSRHKHAFINPHRYLGKALMETRYARRTGTDQLSIAAQCLIHGNS